MLSYPSHMTWGVWLHISTLSGVSWIHLDSKFGWPWICLERLEITTFTGMWRLTVAQFPSNLKFGNGWCSTESNWIRLDPRNFKSWNGLEYTQICFLSLVVAQKFIGVLYDVILLHGGIRTACIITTCLLINALYSTMLSIVWYFFHFWCHYDGTYYQQGIEQVKSQYWSSKAYDNIQQHDSVTSSRVLRF